MGRFIREQLPDPLAYFDGEGVPLKGSGTWRTGPCHFHGGSDCFRVNVKSGGFKCMNCEVKGGDVLAYAMQRHGLEFVEAALSLGAYVDDGRPHQGQDRPTTLSARAAMECAAEDLRTAVLVMSGVKAGKVPSDDDWQAFIGCVRRVSLLAEEYRA